MRRTIALSSLAILGLLATSATPRSASAATSADECVAIYKTPEPTGIDFELQNNCDKRLSCSLGWTLKCESDAGKVTRSARLGKSFVVTAATSHHEAASSASCNGNWRIDDVTWSCSPAE